MVHKNTFGKSRAAEVLADRLNKLEPKYTAKVGRLLIKYNLTMKELINVNSTIVIYLVDLHFKHILLHCDSYPEEIRTYLKNVLVAQHRIFLDRIDSQKPAKKRLDYPPFGGKII